MQFDEFKPEAQRHRVKKKKIMKKNRPHICDSFLSPERAESKNRLVRERQRALSKSNTITTPSKLEYYLK